ALQRAQPCCLPADLLLGCLPAALPPSAAGKAKSQPPRDHPLAVALGRGRFQFRTLAASCSQTVEYHSLWLDGNLAAKDTRPPMPNKGKGEKTRLERMREAHNS